jgi:hypothetical protein
LLSVDIHRYRGFEDRALIHLTFFADRYGRPYADAWLQPQPAGETSTQPRTPIFRCFTATAPAPDGWLVLRDEASDFGGPTIDWLSLPLIWSFFFGAVDQPDRL